MCGRAGLRPKAELFDQRYDDLVGVLLDEMPRLGDLMDGAVGEERPEARHGDMRPDRVVLQPLDHHRRDARLAELVESRKRGDQSVSNAIEVEAFHGKG